ncbi:MAG: hypothetical protein AVDCRST_MAG38-1196 [uncultured Solirubrobacteraceae bacterium]|uniref:Glycosyltransferase subfamily 4-like N-terminal domain-containing protein n=1 Tax=uncultured Solirubrobacteraceae bacterium TaxID=1162706 RepID=A0A6J4RH70_9ACTN|nr:MAG: hypothetical protein AVDCRST_MAG38-1196 [uncultured Solirubrobacteraceae bacterium]
MRIQVVDPAAYTSPYDHALCSALARAGAEVTLLTTRFPYGDVPEPDGYELRHAFYRRPGRLTGRRTARVAQHLPDMLRCLRASAREADVIHFQWLPVQQLDAWLLPRDRPMVMTAHDVLPREAGRSQQTAQRRLYERMEAVLVHSRHGARRLREEVGVPSARVHVIPHGGLHHLAERPQDERLPPELEGGGRGPVVLFFGLLRPYKGLDVLLDAWQRAHLPAGAELWVVGMPRMDIGALQAAAPASVRWVPRFVSDAEAAATLRRADLMVLPYREIDQSGVLAAALAFGVPALVSAVGGFPEVAALGAAETVPPGDAGALARELSALLTDPPRRAALSLAARAAVASDGPLGWDAIARQTLARYDEVTRGAPRPITA